MGQLEILTATSMSTVLHPSYLVNHLQRPCSSMMVLAEGVCGLGRVDKQSQAEQSRGVSVNRRHFLYTNRSKHVFWMMQKLHLYPVILNLACIVILRHYRTVGSDTWLCPRSKTEADHGNAYDFNLLLR